MIPICPKCDQPLTILVFREIEVDFCAACRGFWMDSGELEDLARRTGVGAVDEKALFEKTEEPVKGRKPLCPRCDARLVVIRPREERGEPLRLDRCPSGHGLWFDRFELRRLLMQLPAETNPGGAIEFLNDFFGDEVPRPGGG